MTDYLVRVQPALNEHETILVQAADEWKARTAAMGVYLQTHPLFVSGQSVEYTVTEPTLAEKMVHEIKAMRDVPETRYAGDGAEYFE